MRYLSTRGNSPTQSFCDILLGGLAPDGGLYLPESYPLVTRTELDAWRQLSYAELAFAILSKFIDDIPPADLKAIGSAFEKKRHEISGGRIRASYGHSVEAAIERTAIEPPSTLFHGTSPEAADAILREGLRPMKRTHVHLSVDLTGAREVGSRKSTTPVLLSVRALDAHAQGHRFYQGDGRVWLADAIPPAFLHKIG